MFDTNISRSKVYLQDFFTNGAFVRISGGRAKGVWVAGGDDYYYLQQSFLRMKIDLSIFNKNSPMDRMTSMGQIYDFGMKWTIRVINLFWP